MNNQGWQGLVAAGKSDNLTSNPSTHMSKHDLHTSVITLTHHLTYKDKKQITKAGEMAQWLRALVALVEVLN